MTVLAADRMFVGGEIVDDGWLRTDGRFVSEVGVGSIPSDANHLGDVILAPGFVDMHVHGGGSASFAGGADDAVIATEFHRCHGTTSMLASLASGRLSALAEQIESLVPLIDNGTLAGIHLEGPFLNPVRRGAHNPELLMDPQVDWIVHMIDGHMTRSGEPAIRMITLAPELANGTQAIQQIVAREVIAALGHSDASYDQAVRAIDAGVTVGTHVFNGMTPPHHREPGAAVALLRDPRVTIELINDGIHVHKGMIGGVFEGVGPHRVALVTDAISAAGMPDGFHNLAGSKVVVRDGVAKTAAGDSLAGSTLTMAVAVQNAVRDGVPFERVLAAATTNPAKAVRLTDRGSIAVGARADFVTLEQDASVVAVMQSGRWVQGEEAA